MTTKSKTSAGKEFEKDFFNSFPKEFHVERVRDSNGYTKDKKTGDLKRMSGLKNSCDFTAFNTPYYYKFECKSTQNKTSLPFSMLKPYQVDQLNHDAKYKNLIAGFVFNFRTISETYFISADKIYDFYHNSNKKSFPISWVRENGIILPERIIRIRKRYDLSEILNPVS